MSQKQAKKRRREERAKKQQTPSQTFGNSRKHEKPAVQDLEGLLESGNIDEYAQTCWNLANGPDAPHRLGDEITLTAPCDEHGSDEHQFRLTLRSMMTIAQCAGMEACGEAIRLVASKLPPEQWPCYAHGHREQFQDYFMHGIEPHECLYCGEIPEFTHPAKSIDWSGEIPVKGIDGQEYRTCPNCGSDILELQGAKLHQWGWRIACPDCEWEMKQAELLDIKQYCDLMEQTKEDLSSARELMESTAVGIESRVQAVALKTRMILENIAYAALVSNKDSAGKNEEELKKLWNPRKIFRDIEKIHPNFFPQPVEVDAKKQNPDRPFRPKTKNVLTRERLLGIYRELNPLAHSRNPMDEPVDYGYYIKAIPEWLELIANTLEVHQVMLFHHPDRFYVVKLRGDKDGTVQCTPFVQDTTGGITCAWPDCVSSSIRLYCEFWGRPWSECRLPDKEIAQTQGKQVGAMLDEEESYERVQDLLDRAGETATEPE